MSEASKPPLVGRPATPSSGGAREATALGRRSVISIQVPGGAAITVFRSDSIRVGGRQEVTPAAGPHRLSLLSCLISAPCMTLLSMQVTGA